MPRRSGGSRSRSSGRSTRSSTTYSPPPRTSGPFTGAPRTNTASAVPGRPSMMGGLGGMMMTGMAFGAGSEVAHQAVRGLMGGQSSQVPTEYSQSPIDSNTSANTQPASLKCQPEVNEFYDCMNKNGDSLSMCQPIYDKIKECMKPPQ